MAELFIDSVPSGAQVQIDGEIVGTTPMACLIDDEVGLAEFRSECLYGGAVSCDVGTLHARLNNHDVSRFWWFLTESERRSIAEMAIKNTLFYTFRHGRSGKSNCEGGDGDDYGLSCLPNGLIRALKFGSYSVGGDSCYYSRYGYKTSEEFCYVPETQYGLPCHIVTCATPAGSEPGFGHSMCSIKVVDATDSIDNWIIFQYSDFDIKPGSWQIPNNEYDLYLKFGELTNVSCRGYSCTTVKRFEYI
jgi:hypothetical protein